MGQVTETVNEIARQVLRALVGSGGALTYQGRTYQYQGPVVAVDEKTAMFGFYARKRRGEFISDKLAVTVAYNHGADLYGIRIQHAGWDGERYTVDDLYNVEAGLQGHYAEDFARLQDLVNAGVRAKAVA